MGTRRPRSVSMRVKPRIRSLSSILGGLLCAALLGACTTTTLLEVRFDADTPGAPPSTTQALGTVIVEPGAGSVVVVDTPASDVAAGKWARVSHPTPITPETSMIAMLPQGPVGEGSFSVTALLYVPTGEAVPTIQLETIQIGSGPASFLHVDLLTDGTLRIDDAMTFGHYPHDQPFLLSIQLEIGPAGATAHVAPVGAGTSGSADVPIAAPNLARLFGAVRIWMGYQFGGSFFVDDVLVVKREP